MSEADRLTTLRSAMSESDGHTKIDGGKMSLVSRGGSKNCLGCGITDSPAKVWGWEPGDTVEVTVEKLSDGTRRVVIEER